MKLTKNEEWIIAYLKDKDYVSPSAIGLEHARTFGYRGAHHSCWASPICLRLDGWDVHHINGDKSDNRRDNLVCFPKAEHTRRHQIERRK